MLGEQLAIWCNASIHELEQGRIRFSKGVLQDFDVRKRLAVKLHGLAISTSSERVSFSAATRALSL